MRIIILPYNVDYVYGMYMDSTCYTIMYNGNSVMYHEPRHELYYIGNTIKIELNSV